MNKESEGTIVLIILGLLAYYLVSTGSYLGNGTGHINKAKLGSEIRKYTIEQMK